MQVPSGVSVLPIANSFVGTSPGRLEEKPTGTLNIISEGPSWAGVKHRDFVVVGYV